MSRRATDSFSSLFSSFVTSLVLREAGGQRTPRPLEASRTFEDKGRPSLRRYRLLCLFAASMFLAGLAGGQETSGFPSFVPQDCHQFDCVNLLTNTINLNIPIRAKAGAMPADLRMAVSYYMSVSTNPLFPPAWLSESTWFNSLEPSANGFVQVPASGAYATISASASCTGSGTTTKWSGWVIESSNYTIHPLPAAVYTDVNSSGASCITGSGFTAQTTDGSGLTVTVVANNGGGHFPSHSLHKKWNGSHDSSSKGFERK